MEFTLFLLVVILFFVMWRIERRVNKRMDKLERTVDDINKTLRTFMESMSDSPTPSEKPAVASELSEKEFTQPEPPPPTQKLEDLDLDIPFMVQARESTIMQVEPPTIKPVEPESEQTPIIPEPAIASTPPSPSEPKGQPWSDRWRAFKETVDWEQFTGVKLFAWLGGLALFIAAGFFVKYSIDRNLIPPSVRLAIGALTGIGLIIASGRFSIEKYNVMRHTLASGGIGVLYSVVFAATLFYEFIPKPLGFCLLALVSAAAFVLAVRYRGIAISVLGALGAYATPLLVSMGQGSLLSLTAYLAVVNGGLYQVVTRLFSTKLLLTACAGTLISLFLGTAELWDTTNAVIIAASWIINTALFSGFLRLYPADPLGDRAFLWTGGLAYAAALAVSVMLLDKPGWTPLLIVTAAQSGALYLTWCRSGWYGKLIPFSALGFLSVLAWMLVRFEASEFSTGFILLLLYGGVGSIGPLLFIQRHGLDRTALGWLKVFPVVIVLFSLSVMIGGKTVSFWFWPLLMGLEIIGIGISLLFRAFIQVGLLVVLFLIGGLNWLFHTPAEFVGFGFFIFILATGAIFCVAVFYLLKKLPEWGQALGLATASPATDAIPEGTRIKNIEQWLAAAPAGGVCLLLAVSFLIPYPFYPHPGMATLVCFLSLVLFAVHRMQFEIPGVAALLAAAAAQALCVFRPPTGLDIPFQALLWSSVLFLISLPAPFVLFKSFDRWHRIWQAWGLFEAMQAIFILYTSQTLWTGAVVKWVPLLLVILKLPCVELLLRRLSGHPRRNVILAFHGGSLLFYVSALPVTVLNHGWIGLTFVFESALLLWLNRRIEHPGLRWVSLFMAPAGLLILGFNLPHLKPVGALPVLNSAVLSAAVCFPALILAVRWSAYPHRKLRNFDLPAYFQWLTVLTGFFLINLIIVDAFATSWQRFHVWPGHDFLQWACHALGWTAVGAFTWRLEKLPRPIRWAGMLMVALGSVTLISLPFFLPREIGGMRPFFNAGLLAYLPLLLMLYYLFHKEPWNDEGSRLKNGLLAIFMVVGFLLVKVQSSTIFQSGYPFTLFSSHTPERGAFSAAGWIAYGLALHIWPRRLDRPFRLVGMGLIVVGIINALFLPFRFRGAFAEMTPLLNPPSLVFFLSLVALVYLTLKQWDERWPLSNIAPRIFWGIAFAVSAFAVMNIEIASAFAVKGRPFSMLTHGSLSMQQAYSIGWLVFAIGLLAVGIKWNSVRVRWAAIIAIVITAVKIFIRDLWSLGQLYRVGSLLGLAVVLILVSFLYQRFLSEGKKDEK